NNSKSTLTPMDHGFILNQPEIALARASKEHKPLLIDFFGIWCPPCNMLDEKVFLSPSFMKQTSHFIKLKLDADSEVSWELKSKFKVGGYPTLIIASPQGEEIHRIVGYRPLKEFNQEIKNAMKRSVVTLEESQRKAESGDTEALLRLGQYHLERREYLKSEYYLSKLNPHPELYFEAKLGVLSDKILPSEMDRKREKRALIEEMIRAYPKSVSSVLKKIDLLDLMADGKEKLSFAKSTIEELTHLIRKPSLLKGTDYSAADLWSTIANAQEENGLKVEAQASWASAATEYRREMATKNERGTTLELAYCLWRAGQINRAESLYRTLEKNYPKEFTFYYQHAQMLMKLGKPTEAQALAQKAFEFSYGDNRLRSAHLLAETLTAQGKKSEANQLIDGVLSSLRLPTDPSLRTHRYAKALKNLK
ncbi:MAG: thioredoxin fold domain-containing protein, partial [Bdellovibrionota bacterium]